MIHLILGLGNIGKKYEGTRHNVGFEVVDLLAKRLNVTWLPREKEYDWAVIAGIGDRVWGKDETDASPARSNSQYPIPHTQSPDNIPDPASRIPLILAKPRTYMNLSGVAAAKLLEKHELTPDQMLVIVDDFALPLGAVRIRGKGSDGGHNGLESVIEEIGTQAFPRIRLGIGQPQSFAQGTSPSPSISDSRTPLPGEQFPPKPVDKEADIVDYVLSRFRPEERPAVDKMVAHAADAVLFAIAHHLDKVMSKYNLNPAPPESS